MTYLHSIQAMDTSPEVTEPAPVAQTNPRTIEELLSWVEGHFHAVMGPPTAYFELPMGPGPISHARFVYATLKCRELGRKDDLGPRLVDWLYRQLVTAHEVVVNNCSTKPLLFWRRLPVIEQTETEGTAWTGLYCRLVIPGAINSLCSDYA